jgi:hypothetical protein
MMKFLLLVVVLVVGCAAPARAQETVVRNWHSPETACLLLADIPGMQTRGYQNYAMVNKLPPEPWMPKEYWCTSPYKQIGTVFPIPDNIVYDVTGDQHTVNELKLVLNVFNNSLHNAEVSHAALAVASALLTKRALNAELSDEVLAALLAGRPGKWKAGINGIEVFREDWSTGKGYEIHFTIR